ncbi:MAG: hypothetical protein KF799_14375 [Bdellovibrionales bacterium]|nr:hypothetical protein [Bdellovibrionales bacterium]
MKMLILLFTAALISITTSFATEQFFGAKFLDTPTAIKKWGSLPFNAKKFKAAAEKERGAMAVGAITSGALKGQDMLKVREQMGDPNSYFFSDTLYAYMISESQKTGQETWHLVLIPDADLKKVADVKIHKKCCYKTPDWAK